METNEEKIIRLRNWITAAEWAIARARAHQQPPDAEVLVDTFSISEPMATLINSCVVAGSLTALEFQMEGWREDAREAAIAHYNIPPRTDLQYN